MINYPIIGYLSNSSFMLNELSWIYLAAPLFTQAEQEFNTKLAQRL